MKFDVSVGGDEVVNGMVGSGDDCDDSRGLFVNDGVDGVSESEVYEDIIELFVEAESLEGDGDISGG